MGNWNISIQGTGAHHNKDFPNDADKMFAKFVADLQKAGHQIQSADFTSGGNTHLPDTVFLLDESMRDVYTNNGWEECNREHCYFKASGMHFHRVSVS